MSNWKPITKPHLEGIIEIAEFNMSFVERNLWNQIKLNELEKWTQYPFGEEGNGFWVVAIIGKRCLYYNDIEGGFNLSNFEVWGEIVEYYSNQTDLLSFLQSVFFRGI